MNLSAEELRVLGSLVEKQLATPAQYPLTLNALTVACNQTSSRDPVVAYDERTVEAAVTSVKTRGLARFVHPSHGRSALRFAHMLDEALGLETPQLALLAVLILRGPQTLAELRARTERMTSFSDTREVEGELDRLARRAEPLVARVGRRPGQKEERYAHLLGVETLPSSSASIASGDDDRPAPSASAHCSRAGVTAEGTGTGLPGARATTAPVSVSEVAALGTEVARLAAEVAGLRRDVDDLRAQLRV